LSAKETKIGVKKTMITLKVSEIYNAIQGEGRYAGYPVTFLRLGGCTRKCAFCFGVKLGRRIPSIMLADKYSKQLNKVAIGDILLTLDDSHNLVQTKVTNIIERDVNEWYEIKIDKHLYFVTPEHPFFTKRGLVLAKDLLVNDIVYHVSGREKLKFWARNFNNMKRPEVAMKHGNTLSKHYKSGQVVSSFVEYNKNVSLGVIPSSIAKLKIRDPQRYKEICLAASTRMLGENNAYFKMTPEVKQLHSKHVSIANTGCTRSVETRKKMGLAKSGDKNPMKRPEVVRKNFLSHNKAISGYETRFLNIANRLKIDIEYVGNGKLEVGHKFPDFILSNTNKLCEVYSSSYLYKGGKRVIGCKYFENRRKLFNKKGYEVEFFDLDLKDNIISGQLLKYIHNGKIVQSVRYIKRQGKKFKSLHVYNFSCSPYSSYIIDNMWVHNCDTQYHSNYKEVDINELVIQLHRFTRETGILVISGGEPLLHFEELKLLREKLPSSVRFHLESNGDLVDNSLITIDALLNIFDYVAFSPKKRDIAENLSFLRNHMCDIKVVTDLETTGMDMLEFATMLMPLTTKDPVKDLEIRQKVMKYCLEHKLLYSPRLHVEVFGYDKRGV